MIIGLHVITINFSASQNELWVEKFIIVMASEWVMEVSCMYVLNRISKCQYFFIIAISNNGV